MPHLWHQMKMKIFTLSRYCDESNFPLVGRRNNLINPIRQSDCVTINL